MCRTPRTGRDGCARERTPNTSTPWNAENVQPPGRTFCGLRRARCRLGAVSVAVTIAAVTVQAAGRVFPWPHPGWAPMGTGVCDVQASKMSFLSRSWLARPNSCILRALILLTVPSTAPELYGNVSPAMTASRSRRSPRVNDRNAGRS